MCAQRPVWRAGCPPPGSTKSLPPLCANGIPSKFFPRPPRFSTSPAALIARDASTLAHLEWHDLERVVAEVFDGLGFKVTLTQGSKDGGKDVILKCTVRGKRAEYYVEINHWRSSTRVVAAAVEKLLKVIVEEKKDGGLFLSTYGFTGNAFEQLTTIEKQQLRFGDQHRIVTFCQTYVKAKAGLWSPPEN